MLLTKQGITIDVHDPGEIARFKRLGYVEVAADKPVEKRAESVIEEEEIKVLKAPKKVGK